MKQSLVLGVLFSLATGSPLAHADPHAPSTTAEAPNASGKQAPNPNPSQSSKTVRAAVNAFAYRLTRTMSCDYFGEVVEANGRELWSQGSDGISHTVASNILWDYLAEACRGVSTRCYRNTQADMIEVMRIYRQEDVNDPAVLSKIRAATDRIQAQVKKLPKQGSRKPRCSLQKEDALKGLEHETSPTPSEANPDSQTLPTVVVTRSLEAIAQRITGSLGCDHFASTSDSNGARLRTLPAREIDDGVLDSAAYNAARARCKETQKDAQCEVTIGATLAALMRAYRDGRDVTVLRTKLDEAAKTLGWSCQLTPQQANHSDLATTPALHGGTPTPADPSSSEEAPVVQGPATPSDSAADTAPPPGGDLPPSEEVSTIHFGKDASGVQLNANRIPVECPDELKQAKLCFHGPPNGKKNLVLDPGHDDSTASCRNHPQGGVHEGQLNMVTAWLTRQVLLECAKWDPSSGTGLDPARIHLSRYPGETEYGEYEDRRTGAVWHKANSSLKERLKHALRSGGEGDEAMDNSVLVSIHANAGGGDYPLVFWGDRGTSSGTAPRSAALAESILGGLNKYFPQPKSTLSQSMSASTGGQNGKLPQYPMVLNKNSGTGTARTESVLVEGFFMDGDMAARVREEFRSGRAQTLRFYVEKAGANRVVAKEYKVSESYVKYAQSVAAGLAKQYSCGGTP